MVSLAQTTECARCTCLPSVIIPAGINRWRLDKATPTTNCVLPCVTADAPSVLSLIGFTGPPALPGIPRNRRARLLEWDRWANCRGLPARPSPVGNGGGDPSRTPRGHCWPGGPELGGPAGRRLLPLVPTLPPTPPLPRSRRRRLRRGGGGSPDTLPAATLLLRRRTRPPWGRGWSRSAGTSWVRGGTPRNHPLSYSGRRRAVLTSRWPWASDGPSAEQRIVGSHRHWRPRGRSVGAGRAVVAVGGSPSAPYTLGAGRQCSPARLCAVSWAGSVSRIASGARLRRPRGHWAGRSQSAIGCTPGGGPRTAIAQCSRARWPIEPGRTCGQVARPRAACLAAHQAARPVA